VGRNIGLDAALDHFTLNRDDLELLRNKTLETRLGFAVSLRFLLWQGRFPLRRVDIPDDALAHVAHQVSVEVPAIDSYDFSGRAAQRHRQEIRRYTGFRPCGVADAENLIAWLIAHVAKSERGEDQVRAELLAHCRTERIEPPSTERIGRIVRSARRQSEDALFAQTAARLEVAGAVPERLLSLVSKTNDDLLAEIKADPGNVSLETMLTEIHKLRSLCAIGLPEKLFADVAPKVVAGWRARATVESPSHMRAPELQVRLTLLAALAHLRQREVTDALVDLFNSVVHRVNGHAERRVTQELVSAFKRVTGKENILFSIAVASLGNPEGPVREVVFPAVSGGEQTLRELADEFRTKGPVYRRIVQTTLRASYSNHYRRGLIALVKILDFRSSNTIHQPVIDALALVTRHARNKARYYPPEDSVPLAGVVRDDWREALVHTDSRGRPRIARTAYEICVFQALRDRLRCKEIWVVGADRWRNPDEDLPADFEERRQEHYARLDQPFDPFQFCERLRTEMREGLRSLDDALSALPWLKISERKSGAITLTPIEPLPEPRNLRRLKKAIRDRHGQIPLIDMLKEAALRTGMFNQLSSLGSREMIPHGVLWERLLLVAYALGTNIGIRAVAHGDHGHSEDDLRYVARRYFTISGLRAALIDLANATFAARQSAIWGEGTSTVASDSTHFRAFDQNLFTEWHSRYGGRGVLIYWHVEKKSVAIHSQHITCSASEVAAMIEGVMRHGTSMKVEGNYVDTHGQSEIGFGITRLLGFDLLPRIKQINKVKLYRPDRNQANTYPALTPAMTRPIRWDLIEQNYDMMIKYATAIKVGTASTEAILRRFTRNASHPAYQAMLEVGRAQKTIFVARYLRDRNLQYEIEGGLNIVENWNTGNDIICYGKGGEFASNRRDQQELAMLALHLVQAALVYVNTLLIQDILALPEQAGLLTDEDRRGLTPLFWAHLTPYGEIRLNMDRRLVLREPEPSLTS